MTNPKITRFPEAEYKKIGLPEYDEPADRGASGYNEPHRSGKVLEKETPLST